LNTLKDAEGCVERGTMNLALWVPGLFLLGLALFGLLFAFVVACEKV
jgi:hypothetical protein